MAARTLPNLGLRAFYALGEDDWKDDQDLGLLKLSVLVQPVVADILAAEPGAPANGDVVVLDETHATHPNEIAIRDDGAWVYVEPVEGWKVYVAAENADYRFDGTTWVEVVEGGGGGGGTVTENIVVAASDETTALAAGVGKVTFRMPYAFTLTGIRASLTTAQTSGSILTVDVNEAGASILSTKLTVDNGEKTSTTAAAAAVISDAALADDAEITIDIDQIGDGTAKGLKVTLIGHQ